MNTLRRLRRLRIIDEEWFAEKPRPCGERPSLSKPSVHKDVLGRRHPPAGQRQVPRLRTGVSLSAAGQGFLAAQWERQPLEQCNHLNAVRLASREAREISLGSPDDPQSGSRPTFRATATAGGSESSAGNANCRADRTPPAGRQADASGAGKFGQSASASDARNSVWFRKDRAHSRSVGAAIAASSR